MADDFRAVVAPALLTMRERGLSFPDGKTFAFTVFDDTDNATVANVGPVYGLLEDLGLRTTKSVWPLASRGGRGAGDSLEDADYRRFVTRLVDAGFEIGLHNVRNGSSSREEVKEGLERFLDVIGYAPRAHANHTGCKDNLYWGQDRLNSAIARAAYRRARGEALDLTEGADPASVHFWGDLCRDHISYVRSFVFREIDLLRVSRRLPYHDPRRPYVNFWFTSAEGGNVDDFCATTAEQQQDRLEEGGVCIMYTHFANGFVDDGQLNPRFESLMRRLAGKGGWFVPVSTLLDHLRARPGYSPRIHRLERAALEARWIRWKLTRGAS